MSMLSIICQCYQSFATYLANVINHLKYILPMLSIIYQISWYTYTHPRIKYMAMIASAPYSVGWCHSNNYYIFKHMSMLSQSVTT